MNQSNLLKKKMDAVGFEPTIIGTLRLWTGVSHPYFYELY